MQKTLELFIGSNNTTHKVEVKKIKQILNKYHAGWTMQNASEFIEQGIISKAGAITKYGEKLIAGLA